MLTLSYTGEHAIEFRRVTLHSSSSSCCCSFAQLFYLRAIFSLVVSESFVLLRADHSLVSKQFFQSKCQRLLFACFVCVLCVKHNRLSFSRCYDVRTTRRRAAPARKREEEFAPCVDPAARLPYAPASKLVVLLSSASAEPDEAGFSLSGSAHLVGFSVDVSPVDGPPEIGLRVASYVSYKKQEKKRICTPFLHTLPTLFALGLGSKSWYSPWRVAGIPWALLE
jgi:hypothetical protein